MCMVMNLFFFSIGKMTRIQNIDFNDVELNSDTNKKKKSSKIYKRKKITDMYDNIEQNLIFSI